LSKFGIPLFQRASIRGERQLEENIFIKRVFAPITVAGT